MKKVTREDLKSRIHLESWEDNGLDIVDVESAEWAIGQACDYIEELEAKIKELEDELRSSESILFARIDELQAKLKKYEEPENGKKIAEFISEANLNNKNVVYTYLPVLQLIDRQCKFDIHSTSLEDGKKYKVIIIEADK